MSKYKIVVVGNCQAAPLGRILRLLSSDIEVLAVATVHKLANEDEEDYAEHFTNADFIVTQLIAENYRCTFVRTSLLESKYPEKIIRTVNLFYMGYHCEWMYLKDEKSNIITGPMSDYHSRTIWEGWKKNKSVEQVVTDINCLQYNQSRYSNTMSSSLEELKKRELAADIKITDVLEAEQQNIQLFFTFNHPSKYLLIAYAKQILNHLGVDIAEGEVGTLKEPLDRIIIPNNILSGASQSQKLIKGVSYEVSPQGESIFTTDTKFYSEIELVEAFFRVYEYGCKIGNVVK